jgi:CDP-diglyceride synthetase
MKDMLFALLGLVAAALAAYFLYDFQHNKVDNANSLIIGIIFAVVAIVFGGLFMFGRVNRHDEIHITE